MVITIIVIEEILMANGLTVLMMCYLLSCRRKNRESLHTEDKMYEEKRRYHGAAPSIPELNEVYDFGR